MAKQHKLFRKYTAHFKLPETKARQLAALEARLSGDQRHELRRALEQDLLEDPGFPENTRLAAFCKRIGI